jgi:hypothetical protein
MSDPYDPSGDMLEKMHEDDAAFREADKERFTDEQKASAHATAQAYGDKHPSPHAARDKTEEWDMDERNRRIKDGKKKIAPNHKGEPDVRTPASDPTEVERRARTEGRFNDDDEVEREGDDFEFRCRDGKNLDEKAEQLAQSEMTADIGGLKRANSGIMRTARYGPGPNPMPDIPSEDFERSQKQVGAAQNIMDGGCVQEGFPPSLPPVPAPIPLSVKDTNPKDAVGTKKWRQYCTVPTTIIWELGVAMLEGARKYGRHNYRIAGVRASVYVDAAKGHIDQWWEGEDIDDESKLNHITKAIASLAVLRDAMIQNKWVDDRPPRTDLPKLRAELQEAVDGIFERIPVAKDAYLEGDQYDA